MKNDPSHHQQPLAFTVKRSKKAKHVRITVDCDASVVVTAPTHFSFSAITRFVENKTDWIRRAIEKLHEHQEPWIIPESVAQTNYALCRARAHKFIRDRVHVYNEHYRFSYHRIVVKNMKTRWGSCSDKQNLNFHYRLLFLPLELADYVVIHELCHLKYMNHSKNFWKSVAETIPDYRKRRAHLRKFTL